MIRNRSITHRLISQELLSVVTLTLALVASTPVYAQKPVIAPNTTITGNVKGIDPLFERIRGTLCASAECHFTIPPLHLSIPVPGYGTAAVTFSRVIDPRAIIRETSHQTLHDSDRRPLLLRGTARIRHSGPAGETTVVPAAGTIFLSETGRTLEVALPSSKGGVHSPRSLIVVRSNLPMRSGSELPGRAQRTSRFARDGATCGTANVRSLSPKTAENLDAKRIRVAATYDVLYMATDFDSQWMSAQGCASASACNDRIVSLLNQTSVFYENQLGLTLSVARQYGPTTHSSTTDSVTLLYDFRAHNIDHRSTAIHDGSNTGENLVDLFQLFTGRKMDQKVVGIAFTGVICDNGASTGSHMIVSHKSDTANPVITAHELGHSLNASHTASGIMTAALSNPLPTSFSPQSLDEMNAYYSAYKFECRGGTSEGAPPPSSSPPEQAPPTETPTESTPKSPPETLKLSIVRRGRSSYVIKSTISSVMKGCFLSVRAGTSEADAESASAVLRYSPQSATSSKRGKVDASIATSDPSKATIYLTADYECPGQQLIEISPFVTISPNAGARSSHKVSRRRWINLLNKAF